MQMQSIHILLYFTDIPNGEIFAIATQRDYKREDRDYSTLYDAFDLIAPSNSLRSTTPNDAYVAFGKKGMYLCINCCL